MPRKDPKADRTVDAILRGRVRPPIEELAAVIRAVNPTERGLPEPEARRRYELKSRLIGVLIRDHRDVLEPVLDEGAVLLRHVPTGRGLCHAVLDALDDESRSWARFHLDAGPAAVPVAAPPRAVVETAPAADAVPAEDPASLTRAAENALAAYDYDTARDCLRRAWAAAPSPARLRALLELLVDTLAADADALALPVAAVAAADADVRLLLALAAARSGDAERARSGLRDLEHPRAGEVHARLVERALAAGNHADARAQLAEARRRGAVHADLLALEKRLADDDRREREPLEADLQRRMDDGPEDAARAAATSLLARWPDSRVARGVLAEVDARTVRRRLADAHARALLVAPAVEQLLERDPVAAAALLRDATRDHVVDPALETLRARVAAALQAKERADTVARLVRAWRAAAPADGLVALAALDDDELLTEVGRQAGSDEIAWLAEFPRAGSRRAAAVPALRALAEARRLLAEDRAQEAQTALAPHLEVARSFRAGRQVTASVDDAVAALHGRAVQAALDAAAALAARGDHEAALDALRTAPSHDVTPALRDELSARTGALEAERNAARRLGLVREALAEGRAYDALAALGEIRRENDARVPAALAEQVTRAVRGHARTATEAVADPAARMPFFPEHLEPDSVNACVDDDGRAYFACAWGAHLFVWCLDAADGTVRARAHLRLPPGFTLLALAASGRSLWLCSRTGHVLVLSATTWDVLAWDLLPAPPSGESLDRVLFLGDAGCTWRCDSAGPDTVTTIVDSRTLKVVRRMKMNRLPVRLASRARGRVLEPAGSEGGVTRVLAADGAEVAAWSAPSAFVEAVVARPDGGPSALVEMDAYNARPRELRIVRAHGGRSRTGTVLGDAADTHIGQVAACALPESGDLVVRWGPETRTSLTLTDGDLKVRDRLVFAGRACLVGHNDGTRVAVAAFTDQGVELHASAAHLPALRARGAVWRSTVVAIKDPFTCGRPANTDLAELRDWARADAATRRRLEDRWSATPERLEAIAWYALADDDVEPLLGRIDAVRAYAATRPMRVERLLRRGETTAALALAGDIPPGQRSCHDVHVLAHALALTGRLDEARALLAAAPAAAPATLACDLEPLGLLLAPLPDDPTPTSPLLLRFRCQLRDADRAAAAGQVAQALRLLEEPLVVDAAEVQSAARHVDLLLGAGAALRGGVETAAWLARFLAVVEGAASPFRLEWSLPGPGTWDAARVRDVVDRAQRWLNAHC
ncbi:MAG: hypothetical protein HY904_12165 [Deltaproteobacteria bacterium]|nr:hypothetical protein [Deltaproteobacteria bacterium]